MHINVYINAHFRFEDAWISSNFKLLACGIFYYLEYEVALVEPGFDPMKLCSDIQKNLFFLNNSINKCSNNSRDSNAKHQTAKNILVSKGCNNILVSNLALYLKKKLRSQHI